MAFNIKQMAAEVAKTAPNMNEAQKGGGYTPPEAGFTRLRFVGYYEVGQHKEEYGVAKGKIKPKVKLVFELSGPKHQPKEGDDGQKVPIRMTIDLTYSLNEKAGFYKLFKAMNHTGKCTHMAEMLGEAFVGKVEHTTKGEGQNARTYANLKDVRAPFIEQVNVEEGSTTLVPVNVDPALSEIKGFLWDHATPEMWDSIFIEGQWDEKKNDKGEVTQEAKSKNVLQDLIRKAVNFKGSPIYDYATGKVSKADTAALTAAIDAAASGEANAAPAAAEDALAEIA